MMNKFLLVILCMLLFLLHHLINDYVLEFLKINAETNKLLKFIISYGILFIYFALVAPLVVSIAKILNMSGLTLLACEILGGLIYIALLFIIYFVNRKKRGKENE